MYSYNLIISYNWRSVLTRHRTDTMRNISRTVYRNLNAFLFHTILVQFNQIFSLGGSIIGAPLTPIRISVYPQFHILKFGSMAFPACKQQRWKFRLRLSKAIFKLNDGIIVNGLLLAIGVLKLFEVSTTSWLNLVLWDFVDLSTSTWIKFKICSLSFLFSIIEIMGSSKQ
jgi:hypothetical protein